MAEVLEMALGTYTVPIATSPYPSTRTTKRAQTAAQTSQTRPQLTRTET